MELSRMALVAVAVLCILLLSEWGWRRHWLQGETGRKFVHICVGVFVASWPFFIDWTEICLLSLSFFVVVLISMRFRLFHAIGSVQRPTYGEIFFALSVGLLTIITHTKGVYAAAVLQMALADGLAAIIGTRYGKSSTYYVFGRAKSIVGSLTFFVISLALFGAYGYFSATGLAWEYAVVAALGATFLENITVLGLDNLAVPLGVGLFLTFMG